MNKRFLSLAFNNITVFITILCFFELFGHLGYKWYRGKFLFQNGKPERLLFKEHPYLVGVPKSNFELSNASGDIKITTDEQGNRRSYPDNMQHSKDALNIVCLGGSTTFSTGVNDDESWPYLLQEKLGSSYKVANLGVPGYTTLEAIIQLTTVVPELNPDIVILYLGWNDLKNYHQEQSPKDYLDHGISQQNNLKVARKKSLADYSFILFITGKIRSKIFETTERRVHKEPDKRIDSVYVRNLETIEVLCNNLGASQIYIPQVMNEEWLAANKDDPNLWTPTLSNGDLPKFIERFNTLLAQTVPSGENGVALNSISKLDWKEDHFVDEGHFSKKGAEKFSDVVKNAILRLHVEDSLNPPTKKVNK